MVELVNLTLSKNMAEALKRHTVNYRPMFDFASGERCGNAQVFATKAEAQSSAADRFRVWTMPTGYGVDETTAPVNYHWCQEKGDVRLSLEGVE